jgi:hypothetical protein
VNTAGAASPTTWQPIPITVGASVTTQTTSAMPVRVNATAQATVMTTLICRNCGMSQYSRGVWRRAMPRVNGWRTARLPHAVNASQPKDRAPS